MDTRDNYKSELWMKHMTDGNELKILQQYLMGNSFPRIAILKLGRGWIVTNISITISGYKCVCLV